MNLAAQKLRGFVFLCSLFAATLLASAQNAPGTATLSVRSQLVVLDVVVTDADGQPVPGLHRNDFTILQDGKLQAIRNFEPWTEHPAIPTAPATDRYGRQVWGSGVPLNIFVLDELNTPFDELAFSAENLRTYLLHQPAQLALPSMLVTVNDTGLHSLAAYTRDRNTLLHALASRPPVLPSPRSGVELAAQTFAMLRQIALSAQGLHTHVNLVWLGRGFPTLDPIDFSDPDAAVLRKAIQDTVNLLLDARITLYQVNPITIDDRMATTDIDTAMASGAGVSSAIANTASIDMLDEQFGFNTFVASTGGQLYYGRNDLNRFIADSTRRGADFYTLTYVPPSGFIAPGFHTIRVLTRNPALHVTTRTGFYSADTPPAQPNLKNLGFDLKLAATGAMSYPSIGVRIVSATHHGKQILVHFSVEDRTLTWTPRPGHSDNATITVLLVSLDKASQITTSAATTLTLAIKSPADVLNGHLDTSEPLTLNSKSRSVRLIVRDSSGRIGTADLDAATLSTLLQ